MSNHTQQPLGQYPSIPVSTRSTSLYTSVHSVNIPVYQCPLGQHPYTSVHSVNIPVYQCPLSQHPSISVPTWSTSLYTSVHSVNIPLYHNLQTKVETAKNSARKFCLLILFWCHGVLNSAKSGHTDVGGGGGGGGGWYKSSSERS